MNNDEMFEDLLISQLEMLRHRLVLNIADIDSYIKDIERRFQDRKNAKMALGSTK
jgi:hypothetical protein